MSRKRKLSEIEYKILEQTLLIDTKEIFMEAIKMSYNNKIKMIFPANTVLNFNSYILEIDKECKGLEIIGPVTLVGLCFCLHKMVEPLILKHVRFQFEMGVLIDDVSIDNLHAKQSRGNLLIENCSFGYRPTEGIRFDKFICV